MTEFDQNPGLQPPMPEGTKEQLRAKLGQAQHDPDQKARHSAARLAYMANDPRTVVRSSNHNDRCRDRDDQDDPDAPGSWSGSTLNPRGGGPSNTLPKNYACETKLLGKNLVRWIFQLVVCRRDRRQICLTMANRSNLERARRSIHITATTSPGLMALSSFNGSGWRPSGSKSSHSPRRLTGHARVERLPVGADAC
jgi:hypothetical protein